MCGESLLAEPRRVTGLIPLWRLLLQDLDRCFAKINFPVGQGDVLRRIQRRPKSMSKVIA